MAKTKAGQAVAQTWRDLKDQIVAVGILNEIADAQGTLIRLQNISQMSQGLNRNGQSLGEYKSSTIAQRKARGLQTGKVDLKRTGSFHNAIQVTTTVAKNNGDGTAQIEFTVGVPKKYTGRVEGFRTGKYGKSGKAIPRPVLGMADVGSALRRKQEAALKKIATDRIGRKLKQKNIDLTTRDF